MLHHEARETYGSPRIWNALRRQGHGVGEQRVARLMRGAGIRANTVKKWRATTHSTHGLPVAMNTLKRPFTVEAPNRVWAGDMIPSMSRKGNCWDTACVESFFGTLKRELVSHRRYTTRREATQDIFEYIEVFHNRKRRHSTLGYDSPAEYEAREAVA